VIDTPPHVGLDHGRTVDIGGDAVLAELDSSALIDGANREFAARQCQWLLGVDMLEPITPYRSRGDARCAVGGEIGACADLVVSIRHSSRLDECSPLI
jgi:hypothetical protein